MNTPWIIILCSLVLFPAATISQTKTIVDYYPVADSLSQTPPIGEELAVLYKKKVDRWFMSFIGVKGQTRIMIAAVTLTPLTSTKDISLIVQFKESSPTIGKISTWGYVFDRNHDGQIDYLALVGGATAFKPRDFPADYPVQAPYNYPQLELFVSHCRLVFDHWADDNFDGELDGSVHIDMDSLGRDWVDRWIVARSLRFDGQFDDVWTFHNNIRTERLSIAHTTKSVPYRPITKRKDTITLKTFGEGNGILQLLNRAAKACHLTGDSFFHPDEKE